MRYLPEDPSANWTAPVTVRRCASTCSRWRSLNLLVQTAAQHGEHKKLPATAASLSRSRAIISPRSRRLPLEPQVAFPAVHFSAKRRAASLPRNSGATGRHDDDFVEQVNAIRHVSSASIRHFPRETCRTNCRRYSYCRSSSICTEGLKLQRFDYSASGSVEVSRDRN